MNGPHDLGGQMGFGPIAPERDEPYFHAEWEKRALGVTICAGAMGHWTIDESRHARENLRPADYYASSYYEIWTKALEVLLERHGFVAAEELAKGAALDEVVVTNTIPLSDAARGCPKIRQLTVAPLIAETIQRIAKGESVMSLFSDQENLF